MFKEDKNIDENFKDQLDDSHTPYKIKEVTEEELKTEEEKFGITLPKSYKDFVLKYGFIGFGIENDNLRQMFTMSPMSEELTQHWSWYTKEELEQEFGEEVFQKFEKIYAFSFGDEGLQSEWFHLFDYNEVNSETGDVPVIDFDQDKIYGFWKGFTHQNFDTYMSWAVDQQIEFMIEEIDNY